MYISRIVVRNFRNFAHFDVRLREGVTCVVGENNTGKTNLIRAIRLAVDANLSSQFRRLLEHDIHSGADLTKPGQVIVSVEFSDYSGSVNERALLGGCEVDEDTARIHYRFRPAREIIDDIEADEHDGTNLSITEDYHFQITGGGDKDPATVEWNEDLGSSLRFGHLQAFHVESLPALRDVTHSLRQAYDSPLGRILNASEISEKEKDALVAFMQKANQDIEAQPTVHQTGQAIKTSFAKAAGEAFEMDVKLGMADPSFASIARSLKLLLTDGSLADFEVARNGLGLNNILYVSMLLEYFKRRGTTKQAAGQLLLIEEPEAHLHPQLQRVLYATLVAEPFQAILTTHSTHISSLAPVESFITLAHDGSAATSACVPNDAAELTTSEAADLNRYLDATRSSLLYARKVMLVEGPAELFLIPMLVKHVMKIDLDRQGITVVPIHGTHFKGYAKLFGPTALCKKCAIVCDGDIVPEDISEGVHEDASLEEHTLDVTVNDCVHVFQCPVTFERAVTLPETAQMFLATVDECGYPNVKTEIENAIAELEKPDGDQATKDVVLSELRGTVLRSAERCGKARFAQIASKHATTASELPAYVRDAVNWLVDD